MTYREGVSAFNQTYQDRVISGNLKLRELNEVEVIFRLSQAQQELQTMYELVEAYQTLDLIANQKEYTVGSGASNLNSLVEKIRLIRLNDTDNTEIRQTSIELLNPSVTTSTISSSTDLAGLPEMFALNYVNSDRVLTLNKLPSYTYSVDNYAYRLKIYYIKRFDLWQESNTGTVFSDWDLTSLTFGGSFKLPIEWHYTIVEGALAKVFPDMMPVHIANREKLYIRTKNVYVSNPNFKYTIGY